ncbi:TonB-dependent receptor [Aquidulcibacter sp.]|uniref:TonB-dependent receptor n=1 Tax=Aquidulcibacter sp. TaxID=2052990 RepID=UPI003BA452C3
MSTLVNFKPISVRRFALLSVCLAPLLIAGQAFAQVNATASATDDADAPQLETVVVTAQKRSENLQDTPISVSVLGAKALESRRVVSLLDLGDGAIPSLKVTPFFSRPGALVINIRGVGVMSDSNQPARDQGVGVYVDSVYMGRPQGLNSALYEVESIEVLKGPQGTLFGRNTEGGAVSIITKKPSGIGRATATVGVGNFGQYKTELHMDLPKTGDFSVKIDAIAAARDGLIENPLVTASDFGELEKRGARVAILWEPTANFSADYAYDNSYDASTTLYQQLIAGGSARLAASVQLQKTRAKTAIAGVPQQPSVGKTWGHRLGLDWQISDKLRLKSITAYRDLYQDQFDNGSAPSTMSLTQASGVFTGQPFSRISTAVFNQDQFSQELQLIGETDRLKYVAGATYFVENVDDNAQAFFTNQFTDATGLANIVLPLDYSKIVLDRASRVKSTSSGVFVQGTYTPAILDDKLHLTVGGRWSHDKKVGELFIVNGAPPSVNGVVGPRKLNASWDRIDPMINVSYDLSDDAMLYAKYSTGFRSGGANSRSLDYSPFKPEEVTMYEVGAKIEFLDRRARLNLAAYSGTYADMQIDFSARYRQLDPVTGALLVTTRTTQEATNAPGKGDLKGFEADFLIRATENLTVSASYAYNRVEIPDTLNPFPQADGRLITVPIPIHQTHTPENSGSISIDYQRPWLGATFIAHFDVNSNDGMYLSLVDVAYDPVTRAVTVPAPKGEGGTIANGRLALADIKLSNSASLTVSLWSRNLFNEEHLYNKSLNLSNGTTGFFNEPRTYGVDFKIKM